MLTDSESRALLQAAPTRRILGSHSKYKYDEVDGFLPLPSHREHGNTTKHRSITAGDLDSDTGSSALDDASADSENDGALLSIREEMIRNVEKELSIDPTSIPSWFYLLSLSLSNVPITAKNATKARAEITLSVLSRAFAVHPDNGLSRPLRIRYLNAGEEIWPEGKLLAEWEDALKVGGIEMWMEWFTWRLRRASNGIDGVLEDALRALTAFASDKEEDELARIRIFWGTAVAFHRAGRRR